LRRRLNHPACWDLLHRRCNYSARAGSVAPKAQSSCMLGLIAPQVQFFHQGGFRCAEGAIFQPGRVPWHRRRNHPACWDLLHRRCNYSARAGSVVPKAQYFRQGGFLCAEGANFPPGRVPLCRRRNISARAGSDAPKAQSSYMLGLIAPQVQFFHQGGFRCAEGAIFPPGQVLLRRRLNHPACWDLLHRRCNYSARAGSVVPKAQYFRQGGFLCAEGTIILHVGTYCTAGANIPPGRVPLCRRRNISARAGSVAPKAQSSYMFGLIAPQVQLFHQGGLRCAVGAICLGRSSIAPQVHNSGSSDASSILLYFLFFDPAAMSKLFQAKKVI
jgi:hypothetical protein